MAKGRRRKTGLDLEVRGDGELPGKMPWQGWQAAAEEELPAETPHERLKVHRGFRSRILPDARDLIVYLPPQYEAEPQRSFPVLYMHDGQNLFDPATSYIKGRTWMMREHADAAIEAGEGEPLVIVGIYNTGDKRLAEYTQDENQQMGGGEHVAQRT